MSVVLFLFLWVVLSCVITKLSIEAVKKTAKHEYNYVRSDTTDMDYEKLGDNIRNYREQRGFTQEKLAELSNISDKHLSKIERGKINIKIDTLVNIANALGPSVDKLLLDASSYVEPNYISQITYHLSKLSKEEQARILWHLEQNNVFESKKQDLLKL